MSDEADLEQLRRDVQYLMDRTAILDCISSHSRGHDRHDAELLTNTYHPDGFDEPGTGPENCDDLAGDSINDTPVPVSLPTGVTPVAIAAGIYDGYMLGSNGTLYGWGADQSGQIDQGAPTSCVPAPLQMSLPLGVTPTSISANGNDVYSIGSDGNLYAWGDNTLSELGDGVATGPEGCGAPGNFCSTTPVQVSLPTGHTVALGGTFATEYAIVSVGN